MDFTAPTLGGAVKAVLLPHLHKKNLTYIPSYLLIYQNIRIKDMVTIIFNPSRNIIFSCIWQNEIMF